MKLALYTCCLDAGTVHLHSLGGNMDLILCVAQMTKSMVGAPRKIPCKLRVYSTRLRYPQ